MKIFFISLMAVSVLFAAECSIEKNSLVTVNWTAFKTPAKAGVSGTFEGVEFKGKTRATSVAELLSGSEVEIETANVHSGNDGRDAKLVTFFFDVMHDKKIEAKILEASGDSTKGKLVLEIAMNGVEKKVPMKYTIENNRLEAAGVIDLGDFNAINALESINDACFELHQGKTWQDVNIGFGLNLKQHCKQE